MIGSRASTGALLAVTLAVASQLALAQGGMPIRLIPPSEGDPPAADPPTPGASPSAPAGVPLTVPSLPRTRDDAVRDEGRLAPLDAAYAGAIDELNGGLPPSLWSGSTRASIDPLLRDLVPPTWPQLRDLLRRTLASAGNPPLGDAANPPFAFAGARARGLLRLGDTESAATIAARVARAGAIESADGVQRDVAWLRDEIDAACALTREGLAHHRDVGWPRSLTACQALAGDSDRAQLGLAMQREQQLDEDPWLARLLGLMAGDRKALDGGSGALRPHHLPMFTAAKAAPPVAALGGADPATLAAIARRETFPAELRMVAAERAVIRGALDGATLGAEYDRVQLSARESADPIAFAERERGPRGRAALYKHVRAQPSEGARVAAFARAMRIAEARGIEIALRRALLDVIATMRPSAVTAPQAGTLARALLAEGYADEASGWFEFARAQPGSEDAAALLAPLLYLGGVDDPNLITPAALRAWHAAQAKLDGSRLAPRAALLASLLGAVGVPSGSALGESALAGTDTAMPAALVTLGRAADQRRLGETVLLAAAAHGNPALRENPAMPGAVVRSLTAIGLGPDARRIALDAALAAGL